MKQGTTMKLLNAVVKIAFLYVLSLAVYVQPSCKDPDEFEPSEDTLVPPPDPPQLVSPIDGFVVMIESAPADSYYELKWTNLEQAESYQLEYTIGTFPPFIKTCAANVCTLWLSDTTNRICKHYWRVRASAPAWEWFTEWSEQWHLELRMRPHGPQHIAPPNDTIFYVDSLPFDIEVQWDTIQDEEFYEVVIFGDSLVYDQRIVYNNFYVVSVYDTAQYSWQVRAKSSYWQYYSYWSNLWFFRVSYQN